MTIYTIGEFKARLSEILTELDEGDEVLITRRGKVCGRLTSVEASDAGKPSLETLKGSLAHLPDASYEDFMEIRKEMRSG